MTVAEELGNIAVHPTAIGISEPPIPRTKESIIPQISVSVLEIDPQSAQYSCEVTVANVKDPEFSVVELSPRLPKGTWLNEGVDAASVELVRKHGEICRAIGALMTNTILLLDEQLVVHEAQKLLENLKRVLTPRGVIEAYLYLIVGKIPPSIRSARERSFKIEVNSASDAERALTKLNFDSGSPTVIDIQWKIDLLKNIEKHDDYKFRQGGNVSLKKGQQYKAVFVIGASRGKLSPNSYSLSFDIALRREDYSLSRVEYATLTVPTGNFWTTILAAGFAVIGAVIRAISIDPKGANTAQIALKNSLASLDSTKPMWLDILGGFTVPALLALVVYNIFDMTALKDKLSSSRNWKTAVFVGFVCGFLTDKILGALGTLLG